MPGTSMMGLALGLAAGVAAGLLAAPMRGSDMRASLRTRADDALGRGSRLLEQGRRALNRTAVTATPATPPAALTATIGEIAQTHADIEPPISEARS
jgi:gas vesicle protein